MCEVRDDSLLNVSGILRVGSTIDEPRLIVNGTNFDVAALHDVWAKPLTEIYP